MDRILFIAPPHIMIKDFVTPRYNMRNATRASGVVFGAVLTDMPLGPLSISSYVKSQLGADKVQVRVLDLNVSLNLVQRWEWDTNSFADYIRHELETGCDRVTGERWLDFNPNMIGVSVLFSPSYDNFLDILRVSRKIFPKAMLMGGGGVPTIAYDKVFDDCPEIDVIGFGESEKPFVELLQADNRYEYLEASPCWITRSKKGFPREAFKYNYVDNLDEIPFYDYGLVRTLDYTLNPALANYGAVNSKAVNFHYMTSRGCPYHCNFCASHKINGRTMRYHSEERVRADLTRLRDELGARTIVDQDDNFMGMGEKGRERAKRIIEIIGELGLTVVFQNSITLFACKRPMLEAMRKAGVTQLVLAVESGSARVLKEIMHKPLNLEIIQQVATDCRELGIMTECNILIGNLHETEADIRACRDFITSDRCPADWFKILIATPLVGSEFYEKAVEEGLIPKGGLVQLDFKKANISTAELSADQVTHWQYRLNLEVNFLLNQNRRLGEKAIEEGRYEDAQALFQKALIGLLNAVDGKPDHLFGHHFASLCYDRLGNTEKAQYHRNQALQASQDSFWQDWLNQDWLKDEYPWFQVGQTLPAICETVQ